VTGIADMLGNCGVVATVEANKLRLVACVNACAGINPEAVPAMVEALRELAAIGGGGVIERRETGKPTWSALDAVQSIARAALAKAGVES
jgi:hypothetical protein